MPQNLLLCRYMQKHYCDFCKIEMTPNTTATMTGELKPVVSRQRLELSGKGVALEATVSFKIDDSHDDVPVDICRPCRTRLIKAVMEGIEVND